MIEIPIPALVIFFIAYTLLISFVYSWKKRRKIKDKYSSDKDFNSFT